MQEPRGSIVNKTFIIYLYSISILVLGNKLFSSKKLCCTRFTPEMTIFKRFVYLFCCVGVHSMLPQSSSVQKKQTGRKYIHSVFVLFFFNVKFSNLRLRYVQVLRRLEWYNCFACFYYKLINILNKTFIYSYSFEDIDLIMSKDVVRNVYSCNRVHRRSEIFISSYYNSIMFLSTLI